MFGFCGRIKYVRNKRNYNLLYEDKCNLKLNAPQYNKRTVREDAKCFLQTKPPTCKSQRIDEM